MTAKNLGFVIACLLVLFVGHTFVVGLPEATLSTEAWRVTLYAVLAAVMATILVLVAFAHRWLMAIALSVIALVLAAAAFFYTGAFVGMVAAVFLTIWAFYAIYERSFIQIEWVVCSYLLCLIVGWYIT